MGFIEFVYKLLQNFAGLNDETVSKLRSEAADEMLKYEKSDNKIAQLFFKYSQHVWTRTILAMLYVYLANSLVRSMHESDEEIYNEYDRA